MRLTAWTPRDPSAASALRRRAHERGLEILVRQSVCGFDSATGYSVELPAEEARALRDEIAGALGYDPSSLWLTDPLAGEGPVEGDSK